MDITGLYEIFSQHQKVCTDSRKLNKKDLFFALKGPNFNGNLYAQEALKSGAIAAVVDDEGLADIQDCIVVEDVLTTLQKLAHHHRKKLKTKILALTGSNGKTSSKELIHSVLKTKYSVYATIGNLNNHIGIPLSLLELKPQHDIAIIEMGANHIGEIASYCTFTDPDYGLITNIGSAHLEGFGDIQGVLIAKTELFSYLQERKRPIFLNVDDELLFKDWQNYTPAIHYGSKTKQGLEGSYLPKAPFAGLRWKDKKSGLSYECISKLTGAYNFHNLLAAVAVGNFFEVDFQQIIKAIENHQPDMLRSNVVQTGKNKVVVDAYNANPSSMKVALLNMKESFNSDLVFILGDMLELGDQSRKLHEEILTMAMQLHPEHIYLVGKNYRKHDAVTLSYYRDVTDLKTALKENPLHSKNILVKGSRGLQLEKALENL